MPVWCPSPQHVYDKEAFVELAGIACRPRRTAEDGTRFREALFTHVTVSCDLQISSYWQPGEPSGSICCCGQKYPRICCSGGSAIIRLRSSRRCWARAAPNGWSSLVQADRAQRIAEQAIAAIHTEGADGCGRAAGGMADIAQWYGRVSYRRGDPRWGRHR